MNYIGMKFNKLTVLKIAYRKNEKWFYECMCDCGNKRIVRIDRLKGGITTCCGCNHITKHKFYDLWRGMIRRCNNEKDISYRNYGARGITVCSEWRDFYNFEKWANKNYKNGVSLDRINNNGNYEPSNCRFVSMEEQCNNKRNNCVFYINGIRYTKMQICKKYNIKWGTLHNRLRRGWSIDKCITTPIDLTHSTRMKYNNSWRAK